MAKKKNAEKVSEAEVGAEFVGDAAIGAEAEAPVEGAVVEAATPNFIADEAAFLVVEVQTFLSKRSELAERIAREIEATERRLEELRRTAALLAMPAAAAVPTKADKKSKKPTLKKAEKKPKPADDAGAAGDADPSAQSQPDEELAA